MKLNSRFIAALPLLLSAAVHSPLHAAGLDDSLDVVSATNRSASQSQKKIDDLDRETRILLEEYRSLRESTEYQEAYTRELELLDASQKERIESLKRQIGQARITRQRIMPMMRSMADALEKFVVLDLPFHQEQRIGAVLQLKQRLDNPGLSVSARFRLLLEAYQLEQDYSATLEAWRGPLALDGQDLSVEYLRVGRTALYYQSLDRARCGYWDREAQDWVALEPEYNRALFQAMRVAHSQSAPQLLELPLKSGGGES
jgi:cell division protein FtsB